MASGKRGFVKRRTVWLFAVFVMLFSAIAGRLAYIQVCEADQYRRWADIIRLRGLAIPAARGCIRDRTGRVLAVSIETASIYANPREVKDPAETSIQVASLIGGDAGEIKRRIESRRTLAWLAKNVDPRLGDEVRRGYRVVEDGKQYRRRVPGVGVQRDTKRVYPGGNMAAQILGFTDFYGNGREGLEFRMDSLLRGREGLMQAELDARRRVIPETRHTVREPEDGKDVYLTIDTTIQHLAEQALAKMAKTYKPQSACAIVMNPYTGEIVALANYPSYDPNNARSVPPSKWRNRAVADLYEPGSTLKVLTIAAGLNEGLDPHAVYAYCKGREKMKGGSVPCSLHHPFNNGHGAADMAKIIRHSCNIGAAHVAMRLGADKLYEYEKKFGLLERQKVGFGCEAVGWLPKPDTWPQIQLANIGFGQGIAVTPLQMACVYSTIANGGTYVAPRIIREVRNSDGTVYEAFAPPKGRRVISTEAARQLTRMMVGCVEEGTGKNAGIEGWAVAGKTGSAQIPNPNGGGYLSGSFVASFMGFAPANKPKLVIAVVVNRPQGSHYGATVAAPVFREIAEKGLLYYRVPSDAPQKIDPKRNQDTDRKKLV